MAQKQTPKYMQLKEEVVSWVKTGRYPPGAQLPTELELAELFNVSRQTVRQALADLVREQLLSRVQGRGTFVAERSLEPVTTPSVVQGPNKIIGVVTTYISDYIFPEIIRGLEYQLGALGYSLLLLNTQNNFDLERRALQRIIDTNVTGLIVEPTKSAIDNPNLDMYLTLIAQKTPMIMLHASYMELDVATVRIDDVEAVSRLTQTVIDFGHHAIGGLFKDDDIQGKLRMRGYLRTLGQNNVDIHPAFIKRYNTEDLTDVVRAYVETVESTPVEQRPTAVVCYNDETAMKLMEALKSSGIGVPEDISVVGFDNSQYSHLCDPKLTTVDHPKFNMGITVADLIIDVISEVHSGQPKRIRDVIMDCEVITRPSLKDLRTNRPAPEAFSKEVEADSVASSHVDRG
ncbi:GntR family transcriptional regulator [Alicyclobacillus fastidiosus]|uniref:GntR family transcriptional regulator n=1 Tax=Alicyclobacillus fastidiosus TaxID=392011 RepID=A0ABY6ZK10_9BACL|nr:GntR family transcriptional regulator [Alicyclobacillus fastidiosus]WAH43197.1 GntR family transcriptional regulator [Alicyclobacillus fastidiosus]GMA65222.1 arabinose metabolism transcriptional repressor [Alicyclobacillus fastidiosus]